jgi:4-hydroxy-4-methyl-2-oxoglutarate aldolase
MREASTPVCRDFPAHYASLTILIARRCRFGAMCSPPTILLHPMIENPPLLTIRRKFPRPAAGQLAAFAGVPTGHLVDSMNGRGALAHGIKPISATKAFHGVALTCDPGPGDCLALFGTLDVIQPGDVVLVKTDGFTGTAVIGDLLLGMMKNNGAAGFVTDGLVRDTPGIRGVGLPCYAAGVTPNSPA